MARLTPTEQQRLLATGLPFLDTSSVADAERLLEMLTPAAFAELVEIIVEIGAERGYGRFRLLRFMHRLRSLRWGGLQKTTVTTQQGRLLFESYLSRRLPQIAALSPSGPEGTDPRDMTTGFNAFVDGLGLQAGLRAQRNKTMVLEVRKTRLPTTNPFDSSDSQNQRSEETDDILACLLMTVGEEEFLTSRIVPRKDIDYADVDLVIRMTAEAMAAVYSSDGGSVVSFLGALFLGLRKLSVHCPKRGRLDIRWLGLLKALLRSR